MQRNFRGYPGHIALLATFSGVGALFQKEDFMRKIAVLVALFTVTTVLSSEVQQAHKKGGGHNQPGPTTVGNAFTPECSTLPFEDIATKPDPFSECGNCGVLSPTENSSPVKGPAKASQSHAKNNFCANTSKVTSVTMADLRDMQKQAKNLVTPDIPDRTKIRVTLNNNPVGEGDVVRLVAWVKDAHFSDCAGGEAVNCDTGGSAHNDVHIVLVDPTSGARDQDECSSVTAEMNPHFRPVTWSQLEKKIPTDNVIRVTGPLFFDNAHAPCAGLKKAPGDKPPLRSSLFEVHPVYQFEVCTQTDPNKCDINSSDPALWRPYDQWVKDSSSKTEATKENEGCTEPGSPKLGTIPAQCPKKQISPPMAK